MRKNRCARAALAGVLTVTSLMSASGQEQGKPMVSGLLNVRYAWSDAASVPHGFDIRRVRLAATGAVNDRLDYKLQAEYETSVKVIDAYLRWKIRPWLNVQIGQYKVHYSQETLYGPATWLTIENPIVVARLNAYGDLSGINSNGRDVGVTLYGDALDGVLSYRVGLFNGNGINIKDDNDRKDLAVMLWARPLSGLSLTASHYQGAYGPKGDEHVRIRSAAGVEYEDKRLTARCEYQSGNTAGQKSDGAYAIVAYWLTKGVQPLLSFDAFRADRHEDRRQCNYQAGINVVPIRKLRIQAAYTYIYNKTERDGNLLETQFILQF